MKPRLIQQQTLQWKMNQTLMQSLNILQLSSIELIDFIDQVMKENPLVDEIHYDYEFQQYRKASDQVSIGEINASVQTFYEKVKDQLVNVDIPKALIPIVEFGIDSLNQDGYLDITIGEWAEKCGVSTDVVEQALKIIQSLEPPGIGARTLAECIIIQLKQEIQLPHFVEDLLTNHLTLIAEGDVAEISEYYQVDEGEVEKVIEHIKQCHPKPGKLLDSEAPEYIIPEATIYKENGSWKIKFYKWASPTIKINPIYQDTTGMDKETTKYLKEKMKQVDSLQQAIAFRTNTLENIIQSIVEKQLHFFEEGPIKLKPLTLREVAEDIGVHISTVSRAINQKYVQTDQGVLPIKFFLPSGIRQGNGKDTAATAIKQLMSKLIRDEDKKKPLSDQKIKEKLEEDFGIKIARRTVMKYREQLQIPSSMKRRN